MPADSILVPHDDGTWRVATLLAQHRGRDGGWYVTVRYLVGPGLQHQRWLPAEDCRPLPAADLEHDDQCDAP